MDQKTSSQLDPKMKEAYDRVMGVQIPAPTSPAPQPQAPVPPPVNPMPVQPAPIAAPVTVSIPQPTVMPDDNAPVTKSHTFVAKKGMKFSPLVLIFGAVAFLLLYTVIWIKVFNLSVPFINQ